MKTGKKYKLTDETIQVFGHTLHRIEALMNFSNVYKGEKGGFVESEDNLSQDGDCWVYGTAWVWGDARVFGNARVLDVAEVYGNARIYGDALIYGRAEIYGDADVLNNARIFDNAKVCGNAAISNNAIISCDARVFGNAVIHGRAVIGGDAKVANNSDYIVFKNWWSSGRYFTWTRSNNMWTVGCFYGTGEELIAKAYRDSELSGREYERAVKYVESILKDREKMTRDEEILKKIGCVDGIRAVDAEPNLESIWHDASEKPRAKEWLLIQFGEDDYDALSLDDLYIDMWCTWCKTYNVIRWAYVSELLPKQNTEL